MEIVSLIIALVALAGAALAWRQVQNARNEIDDLRLAVDRSERALRAALDEARTELGRAQSAIDSLTAASQVVPPPSPPPPPLPRARSAGLDDLRRKLRESHREPSVDDGDEDGEETEARGADT